MLKSYNYDLKDNPKLVSDYNKYIKYSDNNNFTSGLECSCLNSPFYDNGATVNENGTTINENNIYLIDKACNSGISNNTSYETKTISETKNTNTVTICSVNLGNNADALKLNIIDNVINCNNKTDITKTTPTSENKIIENKTVENKTVENKTVENKKIVEENKKIDENKDVDVEEEEEDKNKFSTNEIIGIVISLIFLIIFLFLIYKYFKNKKR